MAGALRHFWAGIFVLSAVPVTAGAGEALKYAPAADWVRPMTPGEAVHSTVRADHAMLGRSVQVLLHDGGGDDYVETFVRLQTPGGLGLGRPTVTWDPTEETVTINKVQIIRGGQVIDLLARGQSFFVMRRETQLNNALLTGALTAMMEPEGLQVGDVIDFAYTRNRNVTEAGTSAMTYIVAPNPGTVGKTEMRFLWDNDRPMHWRLTPDMPVPNVVHGPVLTEFSIDLTNYIAPPSQAYVPDRDTEFTSAQFSQYASWQAVSAQIAPYYDRAIVLTANSPLHAEVERIRALSSDPKVRAAAALHLVESAIAYAAVPGHEDGNVPPAADLTWVRRWGDCKAKTALLTALLHALDIDATPVLVDTEDGDGMDARLPSMGLFDHIIVRSVIDGHTYWLDGTRDVDGSLDQLEPAPEEWALPVTDAGETLQRIVLTPFERPAIEHNLDLDVSAGLSAPVHARLEIVERGAKAFAENLKYSTLMPEALEDQLRADWLKDYDWLDFDTAQMQFDADAGEIHYVFDGHAHLQWMKDNSGAIVAYEVDVPRLISQVKPPPRTPGLFADAPVPLDFPAYSRNSETIHLPDGGKGYGVFGGAIDTTLIGLQLHRAVTFENGVVSIDESRRSLVSEVPVADIQASNSTLSAIHNDQVYISLPGVTIRNDRASAGAAAAGDDTAVVAIAGGRTVATGTEAAGEASSDLAKPPAPVPSSMLDRLVTLYGSPDGKTVH